MADRLSVALEVRFTAVLYRKTYEKKPAGIETGLPPSLDLRSGQTQVVRGHLGDYHFLVALEHMRPDRGERG
jgi:hypothetical protein